VQVSTLQRAELKMMITNVAGKKVFEINKGDVDAGVHYFNVDVSDLSEGLYLYTIYSGNNAETKKMIVE
ncbi:MAG: T9SS type A sorting domain-containing protein, partial [Bacteroidales bacterium]|nr:T9SS type A sorting domain-containing protein [Bacteroidales bacterium]